MVPGVPDYWSQFYCFGACPENYRNTFSLHVFVFKIFYIKLATNRLKCNIEVDLHCGDYICCILYSDLIDCAKIINNLLILTFLE